MMRYLYIGYSVAILISWSASAQHFKPTVTSLNTYTMLPASIHTPHMRIKKQVSLDQLVTLIQSKKAPVACALAVSNSRQKVYVYQGISPSIAHHNVIYVCSRGYAKRDTKIPSDDLELVKQGGGIIAAHMMFKDNIIANAPCITFDYPDERPYFNFGQELDLACLQTVCQMVRLTHPYARIVGLGDCRGAKVLLSYASQEQALFSALILISPFVSTYDMIAQLSKNYLGWLPYSDQLLHTFFKCYFPSYNAAQETVLSDIASMNIQLPIFIGQRKNDYLASDKSIRTLVRALHRAGNHHVRLTMVSDNKATHSRITPIPALQRAIRKFLIDYQLY